MSTKQNLQEGEGGGREGGRDRTCISVCVIQLGLWDGGGCKIVKVLHVGTLMVYLGL